MYELKFRVWDGQKMEQNVTVGKFGVFYVNPSNNGLNVHDAGSLTPFTTKYPDNTPVMQYSGIRTKAGVEIWQGDIVKYVIDQAEHFDAKPIPTTYIEEVTVLDGMFCVDGYTPLYATVEWDVEVVGNIYQNPKLLDGK